MTNVFHSPHRDLSLSQASVAADDALTPVSSSLSTVLDIASSQTTSLTGVVPTIGSNGRVFIFQQPTENRGVAIPRTSTTGRLHMRLIETVRKGVY